VQCKLGLRSFSSLDLHLLIIKTRVFPGEGTEATFELPWHKFLDFRDATHSREDCRVQTAFRAVPSMVRVSATSRASARRLRLFFLPIG
jgi:hypothetical protein